MSAVNCRYSIGDVFGGSEIEFVTHSIRKFKMTEMAFFVDGPPIIATLLLAGHSMGQVTQTNIREGVDGDQFCGRVCN